MATLFSLFLVLLFGLFILQLKNKTRLERGKTGFLIMDWSRNHTSYDFFIPAPIDRNLSLRQNMEKSRGLFGISFQSSDPLREFSILRKSESIIDEVKGQPLNPGLHHYVSAVEVDYTIEPDPSGKHYPHSYIVHGHEVIDKIYYNYGVEVLDMKVIVLPDEVKFDKN